MVKKQKHLHISKLLLQLFRNPNRNIFLLSTGELIFIIFAVIAICTAYVLRLTTEIVHIFIFMLALERFFIYFYPSVSISAFHKQISKNIKYTYGLLVLRDVAVLIGFATQIELYKLTIFYSVSLSLFKFCKNQKVYFFRVYFFY